MRKSYSVKKWRTARYHSVRTADADVISKAESLSPLSTSKVASGFIKARFDGSL
jgi:hypothetical protein